MPINDFVVCKNVFNKEKKNENYIGIHQYFECSITHEEQWDFIQQHTQHKDESV